jgi:CheY-like chemotaxis protein
MQPQNLTKLRVLYVEDEVLIALDGEETLRGMGFKDITVAMSYRDAAAAIAAKDFDLALLDINLGGGRTSLALADTLMERGTRVVFLTGYTITDGLRERLKAPLVGKPFEENVLRERILSVLE